MKQKTRLCAHEVMQKWRVTYWKTCAPVLNWISVRTILAISSIHELPIIPTDFLLAFPQDDLDVDFFVDIVLRMGVDGNRGE